MASELRGKVGAECESRGRIPCPELAGSRPLRSDVGPTGLTLDETFAQRYRAGLSGNN